jgi:hypothetical protein
MMVSFGEAKSIVEAYVQDLANECGIPLRLLEDLTIERGFGWCFFYDAHLEPGARDAESELLGNAPVIVDRRDGSVHETGTAHPAEYYLNNYERTGSPFDE